MPTTVKEIRDELNIIEQVLAGADSSDEYLEAIVRNQNLMIELQSEIAASQEGSNVVQGGDNIVNEQGDQINAESLFGEIGQILPGTAGIAVSDVKSGETGQFLYNQNGRNAISGVRAGKEIEEGQVSVYSGQDGKIYPVNDIEQNDLSMGAVSDSLKDSSSFGYFESDEETVIAPGASDVVLEANIGSLGGVYRVGTTDANYSQYQYLVDGEPILDEPSSQPLGLYNDMFEFPNPIKVSGTFEVLVQREESAPGTEAYVSNAVIQ